MPEAVPETVAVREGLFSEDPPRLLGSRCETCGAHHFPRAGRCPSCAGTSVVAVELSAQGTVWAATVVTAAPPGYRGEVPYGFGVVELPEGIRVVTRLEGAGPTPDRVTDPTADPAADPAAHPAPLPVGTAVHLQLVELHTDDDGRAVVTYAFAPDGGAGPT